MKKLALSIVIELSVILPVYAQSYASNYFRNPLDIPILLAGNFGECRPNHFHSGLDIKTMGKENLPVYAAGDGYISRVKMEPGGFGHGIYVIHPNGYTTLYAHLNDFYPELQRYVKAEQFGLENFNGCVTGEFGLDNYFRLFASYQLTNMYKENTGLDQRPFSIGLRFGGI